MNSRINEIAKLTISLLILLAFLMFMGCDENPADSDLSDQQIIAKIIEEDEDLNSLENVINEKSFDNVSLNKENEKIYPKNFVRILNLAAKNLDLQAQGDTAIGILTKEYNGRLLILASYQGPSSPADTVIVKNFIFTVKRKLVFAKTEDAKYKNKKENKGWKLIGMSLAKSGTNDENITIEKIQVITANDTITVVDPLNYVFYKGYRERYRNQLRSYSPNQPITIKATVKSLYKNPDVVTLTYGNNNSGSFRITKRFLRMESESFDGSNYVRVFVGTWNAQATLGKFHVYLNALSYGSINDDVAPVENKGAGIPYWVNIQ